MERKAKYRYLHGTNPKDGMMKLYDYSCVFTCLFVCCTGRNG